MLLKVLRPNLIDYINLSKVLADYMRRCKCTSGESRVGLDCAGVISFSLKKTFLVYYKSKFKIKHFFILFFFFCVCVGGGGG